MSIIDRCQCRTLNLENTVLLGASLAESIYHTPLTIHLIGELGAGKTTLVQGLAKALGVTVPVTSPTFALEQRYGDTLCHIDLCRLEPKDAGSFLDHSAEFPGIRVIEWAEKSGLRDADIILHIRDHRDSRLIDCTFRDIRIPSQGDIESIWDEARVPTHIREHMKTVADATHAVAEELQKQGRIIRPGALRAAALLHDTLRYVDFRSFDDDSFGLAPDAGTKNVWQRMKETYGTPHEPAAMRLVSERGYPEVARIIETHRGTYRSVAPPLRTIEQKALCYADKRVDPTRIVSLEERFHELIKRHRKNGADPDEVAWQDSIRRLEAELFPDGVPF